MHLHVNGSPGWVFSNNRTIGERQRVEIKREPTYRCMGTAGKVEQSQLRVQYESRTVAVEDKVPQSVQGEDPGIGRCLDPISPPPLKAKRGWPSGSPQRFYGTLDCRTIVGDSITQRTEIPRVDLRAIAQPGCQEYQR
jgi:hypothetical protein